MGATDGIFDGICEGDCILNFMESHGPIFIIFGK